MLNPVTMVNLWNQSQNHLNMLNHHIEIITVAEKIHEKMR